MSDKNIALLQELTQLFQKRQYDQVITKFEASEKNIQNQQQNENIASIYDVVGSVYFTKQQEDQAYKYFELSKNIREDLMPNSVAVAISYNNMGLVLKTKGNIDEAVKLLEKSLEIKRSHKVEQEDLAKTLNNLAICYKQQKKYVEAVEKLKEAIEIKKKLGTNSIELAKSYNNLGLNYRDMGDFDEALIWMQKAEPIFQNNSVNVNELGMLYFNMGNVYTKKYDNQQAKEYYQKCIQVREAQQPHTKQLAITYNKLGQIYKDEHNTNEEINAFENELRILEEIKAPPTDIAKSCQNISQAYMRQHDIQKAVQYQQRAVEKEDNFQNQLIYSGILQSAVQTYKQKGEHDLATQYMITEYDLQSKVLDNDHPNLVILSYQIAEQYLNSNNYSQAEKYLNISLNKNNTFKYSYLTGALVQYRKGHLEVALKHLNNGLSVDPSYADAIELKIQILVDQQEWERANDEIQAARIQQQSSYDEQLKQQFSEQHAKYQEQQFEFNKMKSTAMFEDKESGSISLVQQQIPNQKYSGVTDPKFRKQLDIFSNDIEPNLPKQQEPEPQVESKQEPQEEEEKIIIQEQEDQQDDQQQNMEQELKKKAQRQQDEKKQLENQQEQENREQETVLKQQETSICKGCIIF